MSSNDTLQRLAQIIESRKAAQGGDPDTSYAVSYTHLTLPTIYSV